MNRSSPDHAIQTTGYLVLLTIVVVPVVVLFLIGYLVSIIFSLVGLSISDVLWYFDWIQAG